VLGLPAADFDPARPAPHSLVVGYDLTQADPAVAAALRKRVPAQVLFERATCWTSPPRVTADISGLLAQVTTPPWAGQLRRLDDGGIGEGPADDRPAETVADEITRTAPEPVQPGTADVRGGRVVPGGSGRTGSSGERSPQRTLHSEDLLDHDP
jgi:hypothetical protein